MTDPSWLPSAIMQTTGAILGIYVAVYILAIQRYWKSLENLRGSESMPQVMEEGGRAMNSAKARRSAEGAFFVLIFAFGFTIVFNALWLDALTNNIFIPGEYVVYDDLLLQDFLGAIGLTSFLFSVFYVCIFSIMISRRILKAE